MSEVTFRLARLGEDQAIIDFINANFDMRLPLINRPELYHHYYAGRGGVPQFAVAEDDGKYVSAAGYILANTNRRPDVWVSVWVAVKGRNGVGLELMNALFSIAQGLVSTIMSAAGFGSVQTAVLPAEIITAVEDCGFFESIPLWAVTLIGGLLITVLSFVMIMTVYGRFFKLYLYTAIAPVPLSAFAGEPTQSIGISFIKSYAAVCLEGAIIVLGCIIFSLFAATPPVVDPNAAAVSMVWSYVGELVFNMLILVGTVKMADRVVREMMGL